LKALFVTNTLGFTGNLDEIRDCCKENDVILLEDNCESLGTELPSGKAGNFGLAATFSFYVAHHMSTIEGGMVCTDDEDLADMLRIVRANGWDRDLSPARQLKMRNVLDRVNDFEAKYTFYDLGYNLRPTEITGFLGLRQLGYLAKSIAKREENYTALNECVSKNPELTVLDHAHISVLSSFAFPVLCKTAALRGKYIEKFLKAGIEIRPIIAGNMQRQPFYTKYVKRHYDLPGADHIHNCGFYCGNYPELTGRDLEVIAACLNQV